jgi:PIN domain nuclease of toxin-antitoxin system
MSGSQIRLDTHVVVWLYAGDAERLSDRARDLIATCDVVISPLVDLELTYLFEIGRIAAPGAVVLEELDHRIGLRRSDVSLAAVVSAAASLTWTRDPFDRMIAGDASAAACQPMTKDQTILDRFDLAVW